MTAAPTSRAASQRAAVDAADPGADEPVKAVAVIAADEALSGGAEWWAEQTPTLRSSDLILIFYLALR